MKQGISIIVCCYNSKERLRPTIQHLAGQDIKCNFLWEIIVIDNGSTDNTAAFAKECWDKYKPNASADFRIIEELRPGLNYARESGIRNAAYSYILFCDDDNWLHDKYVNLGFDFMEANQMIGAVGGLGVPVFEIDPPSWFYNFESAYAVGARLSHTGPLTDSKDFIFGAGMLLRKSALIKLKAAGFQSLLTDRKATQLSSGGDLELCYALRLAGYEIWYNEQLQYQHFISKERLTLDYLRRLHLGFGSSGVFLDAYQYALNGWKAKPLLWLRIIVKLLPQVARFSVIKTKNITDEMASLVIKNYVKTFVTIKGRFGAEVKKLNSLKKQLSIRL